MDEEEMEVLLDGRRYLRGPQYCLLMRLCIGGNLVQHYTVKKVCRTHQIRCATAVPASTPISVCNAHQLNTCAVHTVVCPAHLIECVCHTAGSHYFQYCTGVLTTPFKVKCIYHTKFTYIKFVITLQKSIR